ncbi:MAG TPA: tail fiber domain-containing protein, partial [Parafilimonas sp.]|nr:tail fiber domain-containing protein [Parafilimonas sp.]
MKKIYSFWQSFALSISLLFVSYYAQAQTNTFPSTGSAGIGTTTPDALSILEMISTSKGLLIPRMTKTQRDNIAIVPPTGLLIYQTNSTPGFYYYNGSAWTAVTPKAKGWSLTGNAGTNPATNFIGTTDGQALVFKINNQKAGYLDHLNGNSGFGYQTLNANPSGSYNTAIGFWALFSNTTGYYNTATGGYALQNNTGGIGNTANGISALRNNTSGSDNTGAGANTLFHNTTGYSNVAVGSNALFNNSFSHNNVAVGDSALYNESGEIGAFGLITGNNVAIGSKALYSNTLGGSNTANGHAALYTNHEGNYNTALGEAALYSNMNGYNNTATGVDALKYNVGGHDNTAFGTATFNANIAGSNNTVVGSGADANLDGYNNSSAFGSTSAITASNQVRIGNSSVTSIGGYAGWTTLPSDKRVKKNIKENVPGLAFINKLKPVTYNLDITAIDKIIQRPAIKDKDGKTIQPSAEELTATKKKEQIIYTGFVAQDVETAARSLNYDFSGVDAPKNDKDLYGLRYSDFVMPLVKAVQELSKMNDEKDAAIQQQRIEIADVKSRLAKIEAIMSVQQSTSTIKLPRLNNAVAQETSNISSASLEQNTPNPFSNTATINYSLPARFSSAQIIITDNSGKVLKQVNVSGSGKGSVQINAATLSAGAYQYSLLVDG